LLIGIGVILVIIAAFLLLLPLINFNALRAKYLSVVKEAIQREVNVGDVRLQLIPTPLIQISSLTIFENLSISKDVFFTARQIVFQLKFWPLLKGQFQVTNLILQNPSLKPFKGPDGNFKFSGLNSVTLKGPLHYDKTRATLTLKENHLMIQDVDFEVNGSVANLTGVPQINLTLANEGFETKPIARLFLADSILPKEMEITGPLGLKVTVTGSSNDTALQLDTEFQGLKISDSGSFEGTLFGKVMVAVPLCGESSLTDSLRGNGKLVVQDGNFTNVDFISKIQRITDLIGLPEDQSDGATTFETLETDFTLASGVTNIQRFYLRSPSLEVSGSGMLILASPSVDLSIEVMLAPSISTRTGGGKMTTFFKDKQGRIVLPLKVKGPIKGPSVSLDGSRLIKRGIGQIFERFFKEK